MVVGAFLLFVTRRVRRIEIISQPRAIRNQKAQGTYAVAGIDVASQAEANGKEACLLAITILPALAQFLGNRWMFVIAPFKFQGNVGCAPLVTERCGRFAAAEYVVFHVPFSSTKRIEPVVAYIAIQGQWQS